MAAPCSKHSTYCLSPPFQPRLQEDGPFQLPTREIALGSRQQCKPFGDRVLSPSRFRDGRLRWLIDYSVRISTTSDSNTSGHLDDHVNFRLGLTATMSLGVFAGVKNYIFTLDNMAKSSCVQMKKATGTGTGTEPRQDKHLEYPFRAVHYSG